MKSFNTDHQSEDVISIYLGNVQSRPVSDCLPPNRGSQALHQSVLTEDDATWWGPNGPLTVLYDVRMIK